MVKKLLTLTLGLTMAFVALADNYPYPASNIQFWTGTGTNSAVVVISWDDDDASYSPQGFAWGVRFNGSISAHNLLDTIAAYDSRFTFSFSSTLLSTIAYHDNDNNIHLTPSVMYNCFNVNGTFAPDVYDNIYITDGDMMEISESCYFDCTNVSPATNPNGTATPDEATIAASDILYWVGNGANQVVMAVNWPDTALAWGYRFDGTKTVGDMMNDIATADPRFSIVLGGYGIDDILFVENGDTLRRLATSYWGSTNNGVVDAGMGQTLADGDFEKWAESSTGVFVDSTWVDAYGGYWSYNYVYPMTVYPVSTPAPVDATIAASAIEYWVGEGANQVVMAVNWPDTALAWGYRFDGTKTVGDMMNDIATADPRFSIVPGGYGIDDILFVENGDTLRRQATSYWGSTNNGVIDAGMGQTLADGDFEKWAESSTGVFVDSTWVDAYGGYWSYNYVYPMEIHAVNQPQAAGPFCGIVGTEGCTAIAADNEAIRGWATACTVVRGSQNLSNPDAPAVTYGAENDAVGAATTSTMDVVSLGDGGMATLTFATPIVNGEGPDFAVFENSFDDYFLELAFVEVSSDGERFVRFPATSLTQTVHQIGGTGRVDATYINNLAGKFRVGYGTPFDLAELADSTGLDINNITHVRIIDVVGSIDPQYASYDAAGRMVNDPFPTISYSAGFDLDGVAVLNDATSGIADAMTVMEAVYPNPVADLLTVVSAQPVNAVLYDLTGVQMASYALREGNNNLDLSSLRPGVYMLVANECAVKVLKK